MKIAGVEVRPVERWMLEEYEREMREVVIPGIMRDALRKIWPIIEREAANERFPPGFMEKPFGMIDNRHPRTPGVITC